MTRRFAGSDLVRAARSVAESVLTSWPSLIPAMTSGSGPGGAGRKRRGPVFDHGRYPVVSEIGVDYGLVRLLREQVADEMTRAKQQREIRGLPELSLPDEYQLAMSVITTAVQRHLGGILAAGGELPTDPGYDMRLILAIDSVMYKAGELQELLDDPDVENIDINGCDEVWVTYADGRGKVRVGAIAATDDDLIQIVQNLAAYASMNARPFTRANPELDLRLPDGSRLSAVMAAAERPIVPGKAWPIMPPPAATSTSMNVPRTSENSRRHSWRGSSKSWMRVRTLCSYRAIGPRTDASCWLTDAGSGPSAGRSTRVVDIRCRHCGQAGSRARPCQPPPERSGRPLRPGTSAPSNRRVWRSTSSRPGETGFRPHRPRHRCRPIGTIRYAPSMTMRAV